MNSETRNDTSNTESMIKDMVDDPLQIPESFIQENLAKSGQKRPGPRTKAERTKRRKEVYRLFFHEGLTATEIAEAMKVSITTINADLQLCYREADKELSIPYEEYYNRQELRIETQRRRLVGYLKEAKEIHTKLAIERQIGDLDFKLLNMRERTEHGMFKFHDELRTCVNDILDALGADYRVTSLFEKVRIPVEGRKAIDRSWAEIPREEEKEMTLEFNPDTPFEELGDKQLRYLAYKLVNRYKALRMDIEEELDFHNSLVRVATKYRDIISRDAELKRLYASSTADATKRIPELGAMLGQMQTIQADILQTAHAARSILRERRKR